MKRVVQVATFKDLKIYVPESEVTEVKDKLSRIEQEETSKSTPSVSAELTELKL